MVAVTKGSLEPPLLNRLWSITRKSRPRSTTTETQFAASPGPLSNISGSSAAASGWRAWSSDLRPLATDDRRRPSPPPPPPPPMTRCSSDLRRSLRSTTSSPPGAATPAASVARASAGGVAGAIAVFSFCWCGDGLALRPSATEAPTSFSPSAGLPDADVQTSACKVEVSRVQRGAGLGLKLGLSRAAGSCVFRMSQLPTPHEETTSRALNDAMRLPPRPRRSAFRAPPSPRPPSCRR